jgi:ketosteroid isomerase-like protein
VRITIILSALSAILWVQVPAGPAESDEQQIKAILTAMWTAIERGDLESYARFLHPDFSAFGENDPYLQSGKELELSGLRSYLTRAKNVHTEMHQPSVTVRDSVGWITYYWSDEGYVNGERETSRGKSTRIFVKEDGQWLCIHGHYTAVE